MFSQELSHIGRSDAKTNFEISKINLEVAQLTRRDSSVMKSIAVLGMVFLPATFFVTVSSSYMDATSSGLTVLFQAFFSMGFFDWNGDEPRDGGLFVPRQYSCH